MREKLVQSANWQSFVREPTRSALAAQLAILDVGVAVRALRAGLAAGDALADVPLPSLSVAECDEPVPEALLHFVGPYFGKVRRLAERSAELHRVLGRERCEPGFGHAPHHGL